jgi:hypothetical protein
MSRPRIRGSITTSIATNTWWFGKRRFQRRARVSSKHDAWRLMQRPLVPRSWSLPDQPTFKCHTDRRSLMRIHRRRSSSYGTSRTILVGWTTSSLSCWVPLEIQCRPSTSRWIPAERRDWPQMWPTTGTPTGSWWFGSRPILRPAYGTYGVDWWLVMAHRRTGTRSGWRTTLTTARRRPWLRSRPVQQHRSTWSLGS